MEGYSLWLALLAVAITLGQHHADAGEGRTQACPGLPEAEV